MAYFLLSVSNRQNLELCIKHALAGFTNSINGLWTFTEINPGDYVSFLYGARVFNLYRVVEKVAFKDAETLPPWPSVTFRSGRTYYFPFRLRLEPLRKLSEPMVRPEFAYVAENLLLRGGYRRTHFQADRVTLHAVSQMGQVYTAPVEPLDAEDETFIPMLTWDREQERVPYVFRFREIILQSLIRQHLSVPERLQWLFSQMGLGELDARDFEVLGEKALPEGHIDLLVKDAAPIGASRKVVIEVKVGKASTKEVSQVKGYADELGSECLGSVLIAGGFSRKAVKEAGAHGVSCFAYELQGITKNGVWPFEKLLEGLRMEKVGSG